MSEYSTPGRQAMVGAATWATWVLTVQPSWTGCLLMLSPFVLVPLGFGLASRPEAGPNAPALERVGLAAWPAALLAALAFVPDQGVLAALLTLPWLAVGVAAGLIGAGKFLSRRRIDPTIGIDVALAFLTVGALWLTVSRAGANPLGFSDAIVQLTAVHFHYAGFALPIVAALAAHRADRGSFIPLWVTVGVLLTAIGITVGGPLEWAAATFMAAGGLATAVLVAHSAGAHRGAARGLLVVAALSLALGMALALGWAWSIQFGWTYLGLDQMARGHGTLNAIGFGFAALTGLHLAPRTDKPGDRIGLSAAGRLALHLGRPSEATLAAIAVLARGDDPTSPVGLLHRQVPDGYRHDQWAGPLPHGFEPARAALRRWAGHRAARIVIADPPPIEVGATVAMAIPVGPISVTAAARIIDVVDEPDRFGFTYATLPHHPSDGEESFIISRTPDGAAHYTVTARWRPGTYAARVLPPVTRFLQRRAISRYLAGVASWQPDTVRDRAR